MIKHLKLNKASGPDNLPPEFFKTYPNTTANILETLTKKYGTLAKSQVIETRAHHKTPKEGRSEWRNWRGITLLHTIGKILATIIYNRLKVERKMRPEQAGFSQAKLVLIILTLSV